MIEVLRAVGIVPVVKINRAAPAAGLARALCEGGLPAVEITFRTPAAADSIREACAAAPEAFVCAGTVLTAQQAEQAVAAAAALSAQEKQAVRRDMKWHAVFRLAAALMLSAALVYVSRVLDLHGIYGWPQGCTMGMLPFTGWLAGDAVFTLRQVKKL